MTLKCFEDNSQVKAISHAPGRGKVLVADGGGSLRAALMGDMIAGAAAKAGWEGIIIFGRIRDKARLRTVDIGIKALAATPRKSVRKGEGLADLPVQIAGVWIHPGDRIFADEDGILVLDPECRARGLGSSAATHSDGKRRFVLRADLRADRIAAGNDAG